jgi:hypothetical protein
MPTTTPRRLRAVVKYGNKYNVTPLLTILMAIYNKMLANPTLYPSPTVALATYLDQLNAAAAANASTKAKNPGAKTVRTAAVDLAIGTTELLVKYVQSLADKANPEQAAVIIETAGMKVAATSTYVRPIIAVKQLQSGSVQLRAAASQLSKAKRSKIYGWQYSLDGGKTWVSVVNTSVANTIVSGLPAQSSVTFRVMVTTTLAVGEWSQSITAFVH